MVEPSVGRCRKCNRVLRTPKSVAAGIGPSCARKWDAQMQIPVKVEPFDPETRDIFFRRIDGQPVFNIEQRHVQHSPSGMEFGYTGSGPADFALNVMAIFLPLVEGAASVTLYDGSQVSVSAYRLYQDFKQRFLSMAQDAGRISGSSIQKWIDQELERENW